MFTIRNLITMITLMEKLSCMFIIIWTELHTTKSFHSVKIVLVLAMFGQSLSINHTAQTFQRNIFLKTTITMIEALGCD